MAAPPQVATLFLLLGASVIVGYVGNLLFRRYRFSDILLLLGIGVAAGPLLGFVDPQALTPLFAVLAPLGLVLVLFDGGLGLAWRDLRNVGVRAVVVTVGTWAVTAAVLASASVFILGFDPKLGLLLGCALAGPGVTALLPLLPHIGLTDKARAFITIEMTLGSLLNAASTSAIAAVLLADTTALGGVGMIAARFVLGAAVGVVAGVVWSRALHLVRNEGYVFAATMGALLSLYVFTEAIGGGGFLMALVFGLVVANAATLEKDAGIRALSPLDPAKRSHGNELIFIFRSLYFVYLGLVVAAHVTEPRYALGALVLLACMLVVRFLTMGAMRAAGPAHDPALTVLLVTLVPRGLSTAISASIPLALGVAGAEAFLPYVFFIIVAGNVVAMGGLWVYERARHPAAEPAPTGAALGTTLSALK